LRFRQLGRRGQSPQSQDTSYDPLDFRIDGNEALGAQLAQWNKNGPLLGTHLSQAVQRQVGAFAEAEASGAHEQERITEQIVGSAQFLLQALIVLEGERPWQIMGSEREILTTNKVRAWFDAHS